MLTCSVLANHVTQYQYLDISLKLCNGAGTLGLDSKTWEAGSWQVNRCSRIMKSKRNSYYRLELGMRAPAERRYSLRQASSLRGGMMVLL